MQDTITWIVGHQAIVAGAVVGIMDLVFALNQKAESNGILHFLYLQAKKIAGGDKAPPAQ